MIKKWNICCNGINEELVEDISDRLGVLPLTAQLLAARGNDSVEKAERFITLEENKFYNPYLMPDIRQSSEYLQLWTQRNPWQYTVTTTLTA